MIIWGEGAARLSAQGFRETVDRTAGLLREQYIGMPAPERNRPFEALLQEHHL